MHFAQNRGGETSKSIFFRKENILPCTYVLALLGDVSSSDTLVRQPQMSPHFETLAVRIIKTSYPIFLLLG